MDDFSVFKERTREVLGVKKANLEKAQSAQLKREAEKLRNNYSQLYEASKNWSDSLSKVKHRSQQLSHTLEEFGNHHIHRGGPSMSKGGEIIGDLEEVLNRRYVSTSQNFIYPINSLYLQDVKELNCQEQKVTKSRLVLEDAATTLMRGSPGRKIEKQERKEKSQMIYNESFGEFEHKIRDLQFKTEVELPGYFKKLVEDLYLLFKEGNEVFNGRDLNIRVPKIEDSLSSPSLNLSSSIPTVNATLEKDQPDQLLPTIGSPNQ